MKLNDADTTISERLANQIRIVQFSTVNANVNRRLASSRIVWCMFHSAFWMSCASHPARQSRRSWWKCRRLTSVSCFFDVPFFLYSPVAAMSTQCGFLVFFDCGAALTK